jgi:hypothetical protein
MGGAGDGAEDALEKVLVRLHGLERLLHALLVVLREPGCLAGLRPTALDERPPAHDRFGRIVQGERRFREENGDSADARILRAGVALLPDVVAGKASSAQRA